MSDTFSPTAGRRISPCHVASGAQLPLTTSLLTRRLRGWRVLLACAAISAAAAAADVRVDIETRNSTTNPGPFSSGTNATLSASFRIDGSVTPMGSTPTWTGALDDLVIEVNDLDLGQFTIMAQDGRWQQLQSGATDFFAGGWGGVNGGSISMFSVVNGAISTTPFVLDAINFDFRGTALFPDPMTLPGTALQLGDFGFLSLVLSFSNADEAVTSIQKSSIIRTASFDVLNVTPVPEPAGVATLLAGLAAMAMLLRRLRA